MAEKTGSKATQYKNAYAAQHYKRVPLNVSKTDYEKIKTVAADQGETVNGYIKRAISERLERDAG